MNLIWAHACYHRSAYTGAFASVCFFLCNIGLGWRCMHSQEIARREVDRGLNGYLDEWCMICSLLSFDLRLRRRFGWPILHQLLTIQRIIDRSSRRRRANSGLLSISLQHFLSRYTFFQISDSLWPMTSSLSLNSECYLRRTAMARCLLGYQPRLLIAGSVYLLLSE